MTRIYRNRIGWGSRNGRFVAFVPEDYAWAAVREYNLLSDGFVYWAE